MSRSISRVLYAVLFAGCCVVASAKDNKPPPRYVFTDLGSISDEFSVAMNNLGQVLIATGTGSSYVWLPYVPNGNKGRTWDVGVLKYYDAGYGTETTAYGINDKGEIVGISGSAWSYKGESGGRPFITRIGRTLNKKNEIKVDDSITPFAINNRGMIVGACQGATTSHAVKGSRAGGFVSLGKLHSGDGECRAADINDLGTIVGFSDDNAWMLTGRKKLDLGEGGAWAVNNHNVVAGDSDGRACIWIGARKRFLEKPQPKGARRRSQTSSADDINDFGQVVGNSPKVGAVLWERGKRTDLNSVVKLPKDWDSLTDALRINNKGQIAGTGSYGGRTRVFLLTPVSKPKSR